MSQICGLIDNDFLFDCDDSPIGSLETDVLIVNRGDVDYTAVSYDGVNGNIITNFQLKAGKTGYLLQGIKQENSSGYEIVKKEFGPDAFKHTFNGVILTPNAVHKNQLDKMSKGGSYIAVVQRKYKGINNADAFEVYGVDNGLELESASYSSNENSGTISFVLASVEGFEERESPKTLLETDYATTLTAFDNKFAQA